MSRPRYVSALGCALLVVPQWGSESAAELLGWRVVSFRRDGHWNGASHCCKTEAAARIVRAKWFARHRAIAAETAARAAARKRKKT